MYGQTLISHCCIYQNVGSSIFKISSDLDIALVIHDTSIDKNSLTESNTEGKIIISEEIGKCRNDFVLPLSFFTTGECNSILDHVGNLRTADQKLCNTAHWKMNHDRKYQNPIKDADDFKILLKSTAFLMLCPILNVKNK